MDQREKKLDSWEELIQTAVNAKAKAKLQPAFIICEMDQGCPRGNRPIQVTMGRNQATAAWDPRNEPITSVEDIPEQPNLEPVLFASNISRF